MKYLMVASSRSGATEVVATEDGMLLEIQHLKSGRDEVTQIERIPDHLTVRYGYPVPHAGPRTS